MPDLFPVMFFTGCRHGFRPPFFHRLGGMVAAHKDRAATWRCAAVLAPLLLLDSDLGLPASGKVIA